jgi:hypothetical protein
VFDIDHVRSPTLELDLFFRVRKRLFFSCVRVTLETTDDRLRSCFLPTQAVAHTREDTMHFLKNKSDSPPFIYHHAETVEDVAATIPHNGLCDGTRCVLGGDGKCTLKLGSPGYVLAELIDPRGPRRKVNIKGSEWLVLDVDHSALPEALQRFERVEVQSHSGNWHALIHLERLATAEEYEATITPWVKAGADKRARDVSRFLFSPAPGGSVIAYQGERMPVLAAQAKPERKAKKSAGATAGLEAWDRASLDKLLAEPEGTNDKAGHLGAMLAQHRWAEDAALAYCTAALTGQNARHVASAMSAFRSVRDGERGQWNGARRLQEYGLALLGQSDIETARPLELRRNEANQAQPWYLLGGEGAWVPAGEAHAEAFVHAARPEINGLETGARNRRRADLLRDHRRYTMPETDTDPWVLNARNGLIDLRTGELRPHDPQQYCTRTAGARYDDTLDTGRVEALMLDWCDGEPDLAAYAWSLAGEAALGRGKRTFVNCYGPTGTGKSSLTALIERALGGYTASVSPETWLRGTTESERQEQLSRTRGARLITSAEMPGGRWHPVIKAFSSGGQDTVSVAGKYKSARDLKPHGLIWITGNDVPEGADGAMRARALFLPLTRTFPSDQRWADEVLPTYVPAALVMIVRCALEAAARGGPLPMPERARSVQAERMAEPFVQWLASQPSGEGSSGRSIWQLWERSKGKNDAPMTETAMGRRLGEADLARLYPKKKTSKGNIYVGLGVEF